MDVHGQVPGYVVADLDATYRIGPRWHAFLQVNNLFDVNYYSLGVLGSNGFTGGSFDPNTGVSTQFRSVGAPIGVWVGIRYSSQLL